MGKSIYGNSKKQHFQILLLRLYLSNCEDLTKLFSIVVTKVKDAIEIEDISENEIKKYKPKKLIVKLFLDFDENDYLVGEVKFVYENNKFNPLDEKVKSQFPRNMIEETKAMNIFRKSGFMLDTKNLRFIIPDNDKIYDFLTNDINYFVCMQPEPVVAKRFVFLEDAIDYYNKKLEEYKNLCS